MLLKPVIKVITPAIEASRIITLWQPRYASDLEGYQGHLLITITDNGREVENFMYSGTRVIPKRLVDGRRTGGADSTVGDEADCPRIIRSEHLAVRIKLLRIQPLMASIRLRCACSGGRKEPAR